MVGLPERKCLFTIFSWILGVATCDQTTSTEDGKGCSMPQPISYPNSISPIYSLQDIAMTTLQTGPVQQSLPNGLDVSTKPIQLSFPLPRAQATRIHLHLTIREKSLVLFLTTASGESSSSTSLGSFVYALPNVIRCMCSIVLQYADSRASPTTHLIP